MSFVCSKYSDGCSSLPLAIIDTQHRTVFNYYGDPFVSIVSNLMIKSITGNSSLKDARVICLSDFHFDNMQVYIRAQIINEVIQLRREYSKEVLILVEGAQSGYEPNEEVYNKLIGKNLVHFEHIAVGWDDMQLNANGIRLINKMRKLILKMRQVNEKIDRCKRTISRAVMKDGCLLKNNSNNVNHVNTKINSLIIISKELCIRINALFEQIKELEIRRNDYLYDSINKALNKYRDSMVLVIGGEYHFQHIAESSIGSVNHCIVNIKQTREITSFDEACNEVYGEL